MKRRFWRTGLLFWMMTIQYWCGVKAIPILGYPINSQVPPVARVSVPFSFKFAPHTFYNIKGDVTYTVDTLPAWLHFNGPMRTFSGTPTQHDLGAFKFRLTATDITGSAVNLVTFVVVDTPPPVLSIPLDLQLRKYGAINSNGAFVILPEQPFEFKLDMYTFSAHVGKILTYYCVSSDNTPLPAWIKFDPIGLRIYGAGPVIHSKNIPPLYFWFNLIAADVLGFSGTVATFGMVIGYQHLQLKPSYFSVFAVIGRSFQFMVPLDSLTKEGLPISSNVKSHLTVSASPSHWLSFDKNSVSLSGTPGPNDMSQDIIITIFERSYAITLHVRVNVVEKDDPKLSGSCQGIECSLSIPSAPPSKPRPSRPHPTPHPSPKPPSSKPHKTPSHKPHKPPSHSPSLPHTDVIRLPSLPDFTVVVGEFFTHKIVELSSFSSHDHVYMEYNPKNASEWLRFNKHTMVLSGVPPDPGVVFVKVNAKIHNSDKSYQQSFLIHVRDESKDKKGLALVIFFSIAIPIFMIVFFFILYCCIRKRSKQFRSSLTDHRYISRPILPDSRYGQWPTMDERTWDEPQRLSAFNIFKTTSAKGLSGFVAEVKEEQIDTNSSTDPNKNYEKTNITSPYSIHVLPVKDPIKNAIVSPSKEKSQSQLNRSHISSQAPVGPPGYGFPHRSWRRTTLSSAFWPGNSDYNESKMNTDARNAPMNESFTVKLVNNSVSHSDTSSGVISNPLDSSTPSGSSKELSRKDSDSKMTIGSYSEDSMTSKSSTSKGRDDVNTRRFRKGDLFSKLRPWSAHVDETDSIESTSLLSSDHSRNEFLCDEIEDQHSNYVNELQSYSRSLGSASDSGDVQYRIATRVSTPLHTCVQTPSKTEISQTMPHRKASLVMKSTVLDRPKVFEYSRPFRANHQLPLSQREESSDTAFI